MNKPDISGSPGITAAVIDIFSSFNNRDFGNNLRLEGINALCT